MNYLKLFKAIGIVAGFSIACVGFVAALNAYPLIMVGIAVMTVTSVAVAYVYNEVLR